MKENSVMLIIPRNEEDIYSPSKIIENLKLSKDLELIDINKGSEEKCSITVSVKIGENDIDFQFYPTELTIPEFINTNHFFTDIDREAINKSEVALVMDMEYKGDIIENYHNQLKIVNVLVADKLAVLDVPSEKILSGKWVKIAAESMTAPSPKYIYTVQAISDSEESDEVWLHTHGLGRCGFSELEILDSTKKMCSAHYNVIDILAKRLIENNSQPEFGEPIFLARFSDEIGIVATIIPWQEALQYYPNIEYGTQEDRQDPVHSENNGCIMIYSSEDDYKNKRYSKISHYDGVIENNPIYMLSKRETDRMSNLAKERFEYVRELSQKSGDWKILVKIGMEVDEQYRGENSECEREHLWFELDKVTGNIMTAELINEPYYISSLKKGDVVESEIDDITDWCIITKERRYTPDDVYMM